jgi:5-(carboxyamino)imidazole ribonucleotide synthase
MIAPGSTIGLMGGGQLGRMFAIAARRMGYRVHTLEPTPDCPAGQVSDLEINAPYDDPDALDQLLRGVDAVTFEFENIPHAALKHLAAETTVRPGPHVLLTCQNRRREKEFLQKNGFATAPFRVVSTEAQFLESVVALGFPSVLKTADFGYDGKGQVKISSKSDLQKVWREFRAPVAVLEGWIDCQAELSVVCARTSQGEVRAFPVAENIHTDHILEYSIVPARFSKRIQSEAKTLAKAIAESLEVVGLLAVELFLTRDDKLIVNELAPRPHNSGHYTFDACLTCQFEQQLRAVCDLPLGDTHLFSPVVMVNLLGDLWNHGDPDWLPLLREPSVKLHLYGKKTANPGRKMGHFCVVQNDPVQALDLARNLKDQLVRNARRG